MKHELDIEKWDRKEQFRFFREFEEPFFGVVVNIDCTKAYKAAKQKGVSFFLYYLHKSLAAANTVENFRYRLEGDKVMVYDQIHAAPTIFRPNNTFGFGHIYFHEDFGAFYTEACKETDRVKTSGSLMPPVTGNDVVHFSAIPWINFTSVSHARRFSINDSCPKISFGQITETGDKRAMPVSVHVHHALADGYHVGQFLVLFQKLMDEV